MTKSTFTTAIRAQRELTVPPKPRTIAVALHNIEPATFERCALIRDWLDDHGIDRVTLLVIPARDLHPLGERSPEMVDWLLERQHRGDAIAQHGFQHERLRRPALSGRMLAPAPIGRTAHEAEFVGLNGPETRRAVEAGWRLLKLAGIEPQGFVAPAYAYTPALRHVLGARFRWWASLLSLHGPIPAQQVAGDPFASRLGEEDLPGADERRWRRHAPTWTPRSGSRLGRALSPTLVRSGAALAGSTLRLDLHPGDLERPRYMLALEWALAHTAKSRDAVTYDELASPARDEEFGIHCAPQTPTLHTS